MKTIKRLRIAALIEGWSYLLLLFIAMPLKYAMGIPLAVRIVGSAHGLLFTLVAFLLLHAWLDKKITLGFSIQVFISLIIPFGTFFMDKRLRQLEES
ncbi:MAG: DUF3817 domain-containing protein [Myxococcota bacterium]|nr:DUF3817 domain-containing protein [Myxococcota bacterium]